VLRKKLDLDHPLVDRYSRWLSGFSHGDLGLSAAGTVGNNAQETITAEISGPLANSAELAGVTIVLLIPLSLALGVLLATRAGKPVDHLISTLSLGGISLPEFVTATLLIVLFAGTLGWLPAVSLIDPGKGPLDSPQILVLPVATLLIATLAQAVRMVRAGMIEALRSDYVRAARLGGVPEGRVLWGYALRNALAPSVQVLALCIQYLVGGIVITETVFGYPGLGSLLVNAVNLRDTPTVQSIALLLAAVYIGLNILADLLVVYLVPKLRTGQWMP
jgi:peptide/nickel transport system permease protein